MKKSMFLFILVFSSSAFSKNIFWCEPSIRLKKLEAVIIKEENSQQLIAVYTESKRWGAVDEKIEPLSKKIINDATEFVSNTSSVIFNYNTDQLKPGSYVSANFQDSTHDIIMKINCEYLPY